MSSINKEEMSLQDFAYIIKSWWKYFLLQWKWIFIAGVLSALTGILYASLQKPVYTAELTFAAENDNASSFGSYAGLAAQFGVDLSSGSGSIFEGDNLIELLKSRLLVEKTLLFPIIINQKKELLINYFIKANSLDKKWKKDLVLSKVIFQDNQQPGYRPRDSVLKEITTNIIDKSLTIDKVDKNLSIVSVKMKSSDELFAKLFAEQLANNAIAYYIDYKLKKSRQNVQILQRQVDSIRSLLTGGIASVAEANDLNVNPLRQVVRVGVQKKQVDVQVNSQIYGELLKQLEISKITLRKETPLIQLIDTPQLPLDKKKLGRLAAAIIFGFVGTIIILTFFALKRLFGKKSSAYLQLSKI